jgi:hypothetical protein
MEDLVEKAMSTFHLNKPHIILCYVYDMFNERPEDIRVGYMTCFKSGRRSCDRFFRSSEPAFPTFQIYIGD